MNDVIPFAYGDHRVRTLTVDGEPWFVLADICKILEIGNPSMVAERLDGDALSTTEVTDALGRTQHARTVSEPGLYDVIFLSRKPEARQFRRWVTTEVLPSIRKHGAYLTPDALRSAIADPDFAIGILTDLKAERDRRAALEVKVEADAPKVLFADAVATSHTDILVGDLAKILRGNGIQVGGTRLFRWLRENGYLIRREGTDYNSPTQRSMELGLFRVKETAVTHSDGHVSISKTPKVTGKGQTYFVSRFLDGRFNLEGQAA